MSAEFWQRWSAWRHGEPGSGTFADVMRVLRVYESFATFAAAQVPAERWTVLDLGCGAGQMAGPLARALTARGGSLGEYIGVDYGDAAFLTARVARELEREGVNGRFVAHDLARGLPAIKLDGPLLVTSCWGVTYLPLGKLGGVFDELAAVRPAAVCVNLISAGKFDRRVLTRKFLLDVTPRQVWASVRAFDPGPVRDLSLAFKALPRMRAFGDELAATVPLMPVEDLLGLLEQSGRSPHAIDRTALWGQTVNLAFCT